MKKATAIFTLLVFLLTVVVPVPLVHAKEITSYGDFYLFTDVDAYIDGKLVVSKGERFDIDAYVGYISMMGHTRTDMHLQMEMFNIFHRMNQ